MMAGISVEKRADEYEEKLQWEWGEYPHNISKIGKI